MNGSKKENSMSFKSSFTSMVTTLAIAGALAMPIYAQQAAPAAPAAKASKPAASPKSSVVEHAAKGSIVSMTDKTMVVRLRENKDMTIAMTPDTQKNGDISTGKNVTVHYRNENRSE